MLPTHPFNEITLWKHERERFLNLLFTTSLKHDLEIALITATHGPSYKIIEVATQNAAHLYHVKQMEEIRLGVDLLLNTVPWLQRSFCIIWCNRTFVESLARKPHYITAPVHAIERFIPDEIIGYAHPTDDSVVFCGTPVAEEVVAEVLREFRATSC